MCLFTFSFASFVVLFVGDHLSDWGESKVLKILRFAKVLPTFAAKWSRLQGFDGPKNDNKV
jgi:hypothetical protein